MAGDGTPTSTTGPKSFGEWWTRRRRLKKRRLARMSRRQRILRRIGLTGTWALGLFALGLSILALLVYKIADVPAPNEVATNQSATLLYSDGSTLATVGSENRKIVPLSMVPQTVRDAVLAAEDRNFYSEPGISIKGTIRAAINDVTGGNRQGGSGITQQYVKNAYTDASPTLSRKLKELAIALKLSREHSKDEILEYYLNTIYWGRGNTYGIAAAAQAYFGIPIDKLNTAQGALLAGIIKAPNYYDPQINPEAANERFQYVLDGMVSMGKLVADERITMTMPKTIKQKSQDSVDTTPLGFVKRQALAELPAGIDSELNTRGLVITTTIDKSAQGFAEQAVNQNFANLTEQQKKQGMRPALVAINPANGAVVAYYGGKKGTDFDFASGYRPPGSSFKPYTLAAALQANLQGEKDRDGKQYNIQSTFNGSFCVDIDATHVCNDPSDQQYSGITTLAYAMKVSLNTTFDGLAYAIGPEKVRAMAWAAGIAQKTQAGKPTLTRKDGSVTFGIGIGDSDYAVRPIDQANGFATFANGGTSHAAYFVSKVTDSKGHVLYEHKDAGKRAMDPKVANDVALTLKPIAAWSLDPLADGRESGAKTGTAGIEALPGVPAENVGQNSDAWMVGFTPQISTAVWVGTNASGPISNSYGGQEYGRDLPGKTWKTFMDLYLAGKPKLPLPTQQQIFIGQSGKPTPTPTTSASTSHTSSAPASTSAKPTPTPTPTTSFITILPSTSFATSTPPATSYQPPTPTSSFGTCGGFLQPPCPTPSGSTTPSTSP